jgi:hypothetical protein
MAFVVGVAASVMQDAFWGISVSFFVCRWDSPHIMLIKGQNKLNTKAFERGALARKGLPL